MPSFTMGIQPLICKKKFQKANPILCTKLKNTFAHNDVA